VVVTKGFLEAGEGVRTISETLAGREFALVGGPMVAGEIAAGKPAGGVIASSSERAIDAAAGLRSALLSLEVSPDVRGVELCSALKNVYAIMVGVAESRGANLRSLAFSRSLQELSALCGSLGGAPGTALGPAGSGDLYVTSISGRNGEFGRRVGSGEDPRELLRSMEGEGKTVEGVRAALLGSRYLDRRKQATPLILEGVARLCSGAAGPEELLGLLAG
jgi:glycerol-3-phosphate dehydrogenase (NAD(P)+)